MPQSNSITVIIESPPFSTIAGKEGVDLALVCAAFEQKVNLIYCGLGVLHLVREQDSDAFEDKLHDKQLGALAFYDIEQIYYATDDLTKISLPEASLIAGCQALTNSEIKTLVDNSTYTVTF